MRRRPASITIVLFLIVLCSPLLVHSSLAGAPGPDPQQETVLGAWSPISSPVGVMDIPWLALGTRVQGISPIHQLLAQQQKKKRVPKEKDEEKEDTDDDDEEEDDDEPCFGFLGGCLLGILGGGDDGSSTSRSISEPAPAAPRPDIPVGAERSVWPRDAELRDLPVWSAPGGAARGGDRLYRLERGSRVRVNGTAEIEGVTWLSIVPFELEPTVGWVPAADLIEVTTPTIGSGSPGMAAPLEPENEEAAYRWPVWQAVLDLGVIGALDFSSELDDEYRNVGFRGGVGARYFPGGPLFVSTGYAFSFQDGNPAYDYVVGDSTRIDRPTDTGIQTHQLRILVGIAGADKDIFPTGAIGISLLRVREAATIEFEELEGGAVVARGVREDSQARWKVGYTVELGVAGFAARDLPIGVHFGATFIPWSAERKESLPLDWVEDNAIVLLYGGASIGYSIF